MKDCLLLFLLVGFVLSSVHAQKPQKMSYYDSLIYAQQHPQTPSKSAKTTARSNTPVDSALMKADDVIDRIYDEQKPLPSALWYGKSFQTNRVRVRQYPMDSLPDEINIRLVKKDDEFCFPVKNVRTSPYGWRWNRPHRGVDIALNTGDPVRCVFPGVVRVACPMGAYGNLVVVRHYNGLETVYGHLSKINVRPKQEVNAGTVLGLGGSTGRSTGPHLHFEVRFQYEAFDPEWILDFSNYTLRTHRLHLDKSYFGIAAPKGSKPAAYKADKSYVKETVQPERTVKKEIYHTTTADDTYKYLAIKYQTTPEKLREMNPGAPKRLHAGIKLRVR